MINYQIAVGYTVYTSIYFSIELQGTNDWYLNLH